MLKKPTLFRHRKKHRNGTKKVSKRPLKKLCRDWCHGCKFCYGKNYSLYQ